VGLDARPEPIDLARSLKYPPDLAIDVTKIKAEDALAKVKELDPEKPFEGVDGMDFTLADLWPAGVALTSFRCTAVILLADPQESVDYAVKLTARHGLVVLVSQPAAGVTLQFL
jgi:hypothetical protein